MVFSFHSGRNAAVLELADRFVGDMPEDLAARLGLKSSARRVLISAASQRHAIARRAIASQLDSELVGTRIAEAFSRVRYQLLPQRDPRVLELLGHVESANRWLLLALKVVRGDPIAAKSDELWVRTAHPYGDKKFRKAMRKGFLVDLTS